MKIIGREKAKIQVPQNKIRHFKTSMPRLAIESRKTANDLWGTPKMLVIFGDKEQTNAKA